MKRIHSKLHKKHKRHLKKHMSFLEAVRLYGTMPVGV